MRPRLICALAILALALALPGGAAGAAPRPAFVYLALGDSLAAGVGAPAGEGYVPRLAAFFAAPRHGNAGRLANLGVPGETSASLLAPGGQLDRALALIADARTNVRVVTLDIGGNDILGLLGREPCRSTPASAACQEAVRAALAAFAASYAQALAALTAALADDPGHESLLALTYYNPFSGTGSPYEPAADLALLGGDGVIDCVANAAASALVGLNDLIACLGAHYGATVVDVYPAFEGRGPALTNILAGDIHPNAAGYAAIAAAVRAAYKAHGFAP